MLALKRPPATQVLRVLRPLHTTSARHNLVGPSDPVSNLRPVIYDDALPPAAEGLPHPYSLAEFRGDPREYQWKLHRQQLDDWNHAFWTETNGRFEAAKASVLESLPPGTSADERENALSEFYKQWVQQETHRQDAYTREWRQRNFEEIRLAARVLYRKLKARIGIADATASSPTHP
ncbi:hypothetical protein OF83DRAFT_1095271 [Amylostereum chailletii]|nr:hypothetical protein OF83DRAFT_1095271 [Amylostereum chailletii]